MLTPLLSLPKVFEKPKVQPRNLEEQKAKMLTWIVTALNCLHAEGSIYTMLSLVFSSEGG